LREQLLQFSSAADAVLGWQSSVSKLEAYRDDQIQRNVNSIESPISNPETQPQQAFIFENDSRSSDLTYNLQIGDILDDNEGNSAYRRDLDLIINRAQEEKLTAEDNLATLAQDTLNTSDDESITAMTKRLSDLRSQLEAETARLNELTSQRDLKLNAYNALAQKETEVRNNLQTSAIVTLASPAITPTVPLSRCLPRIQLAIDVSLVSSWVSSGLSVLNGFVL
jgi:hypothetical protein